MGCSMPEFPCVAARVCSSSLSSSRGNAIQPSLSSHPLSSRYSLRFQCFSSIEAFPVNRFLHQLAEILELQLRHRSFVNIRDWLRAKLTGWDLLASRGLSSLLKFLINSKHQCFKTPVFFIVEFSHPCTATKNAMHLYMNLCWQVIVSFWYVSRLVMAVFKPMKWC